MATSGQKFSIWKSDGFGTVCAVFLLLCAAGSKITRPTPVNAEPYHARIRAVAASIPLRTGEWIGIESPIPSVAIDELHPNVIISRQLRNVNTGAVARFLLVQCRDVRDLAPHYPPVCYPGQGLTLMDKKPVMLQVDDLQVSATRYVFESNSFQSGGIVHVDNFMILPDGRFQPDMQGMERRIGADQRYFGAAQIQILHEDHLPESDQTAESQAILLCYKPLIDSIANGVRK